MAIEKCKFPHIKGDRFPYTKQLQPHSKLTPFFYKNTKLSSKMTSQKVQIVCLVLLALLFIQGTVLSNNGV
jgi:hypothetical protein